MEIIVTFIVLFVVLSIIGSIGKTTDRLTVSGSTKWRRTPVQAWFRQVFFGIIGFILILAALGAVIGCSKSSSTSTVTEQSTPIIDEVPSTVSPTAGTPFSPTPPADNLEADLPPK